MNIFTLFATLALKSDDYEKGIGEAEKSTGGLAASMQGKLGKGLKVAGAAFAAAGAAAGAAAAAIYKTVQSSAAASDKIDKMSQKIGISRESYQELDYVLSQNGMSVDQLQAGMKTLTNQMQSAQEGGKKAQAAFKTLGISATDTNGALRKQEDVLFETIAALQGMENETERNALASDLFGKSASELAPLLNAGAGSMDELRQKAHELGLVLDDETIDSGVAFTDTMDTVKRTLGSVMTKIGSGLMPIVQQALDWVLEHMPQIQATCEKVFGVLATVVDYAGQGIKWLTGIAEQYYPQMREIAVQAFDTIKKAVEWLMDAFQKYFPIIRDWAVDTFNKIADYWNSTLKPCFEAIGGFIQNVLWPAFKTVFQNFIVPMIKTTFGTISQLWNGTLKPVFNGIITFLTGTFSGNWRKAWDGVKSVFSGFANGLGTIFRTPINYIIDLINGFLRGLNGIQIPDWVPGVGGKGFHVNLIPHLAKGGILEKGQIGLLEGNGAEAVVPLENNRKWIAAVARQMDYSMEKKPQRASESLRTQPTEVTIHVHAAEGQDEKRIATAVAREFQRVLEAMPA